MRWKHVCTDERYRPTYQSWLDMRKRCNFLHHPKYHRYGGRGITVCERWQNDFDAFIEDMGIRPPGLTLERVDNDAGYDPFNCIWATMKVQALNTERSINCRTNRALQIIEIQENKNLRKATSEKLKQDRLAAKIPYVPQSPVHGSKRMYHKHKCRCGICVTGFRRRAAQKSIRIAGTVANQNKKDYLKHYRLRKKLEYDL